MDVRKIMTLVIIIIAVFLIVIWGLFHVNFLKEITPLSSESIEKTIQPEEPELPYAITTNAIPADRQRILEDKRLETEHTRNVNRAEALTKQKELEKTLLSQNNQDNKSAPPPLIALNKDMEPPTADELKELESKGIISY